MCGEKSTICRPATPSLGSPPRVRGKAPRARVVVLQLRITPACAGKSFQLTRFPVALKDHPRVCGEKMQYLPMISLSMGSPPRVRGKEEQESSSVLRVRITPACAGKSAASSGTRSHSGDHPRVCGEKARDIRSMCVLRGSPPRVRGKVIYGAVVLVA